MKRMNRTLLIICSIVSKLIAAQTAVSTKPNNNSRRGLDMEYGSGGRKPKYSNSGDSTKRPKIDSTFQLI